jgi:hypothetical protein
MTVYSGSIAGEGIYNDHVTKGHVIEVEEVEEDRALYYFYYFHGIERSI